MRTRSHRRCAREARARCWHAATTLLRLDPAAPAWSQVVRHCVVQVVWTPNNVSCGCTALVEMLNSEQDHTRWLNFLCRFRSQNAADPAPRVIRRARTRLLHPARIVLHAILTMCAGRLSVAHAHSTGEDLRRASCLRARQQPPITYELDRNHRHHRARAARLAFGRVDSASTWSPRTVLLLLRSSVCERLPMPRNVWGRGEPVLARPRGWAGGVGSRSRLGEAAMCGADVALRAICSTVSERCVCSDFLRIGMLVVSEWAVSVRTGSTEVGDQ